MIGAALALPASKLRQARLVRYLGRLTLPYPDPPDAMGTRTDQRAACPDG